MAERLFQRRAQGGGQYQRPAPCAVQPRPYAPTVLPPRPACGTAPAYGVPCQPQAVVATNPAASSAPSTELPSGYLVEPGQNPNEVTVYIPAEEAAGTAYQCDTTHHDPKTGWSGRRWHDTALAADANGYNHEDMSLKRTIVVIDGKTYVKVHCTFHKNPASAKVVLKTAGGKEYVVDARAAHKRAAEAPSTVPPAGTIPPAAEPAPPVGTPTTPETAPPPKEVQPETAPPPKEVEPETGPPPKEVEPVPVVPEKIVVHGHEIAGQVRPKEQEAHEALNTKLRAEHDALNKSGGTAHFKHGDTRWSMQSVDNETMLVTITQPDGRSDRFICKLGADGKYQVVRVRNSGPGQPWTAWDESGETGATTLLQEVLSKWNRTVDDGVNVPMNPPPKSTGN